MYAIKTEVVDPRALSWLFDDQKTMYGGKRVREGDRIFVFASETAGGAGLVATGVVTSVRATPKQPGVARQTPRISIAIVRDGAAKRRVGRAELKACDAWGDGRPETELNFKLYRQATDKIVGLTPETADFLASFF